MVSWAPKPILIIIGPYINFLFVLGLAGGLHSSLCKRPTPSTLNLRIDSSCVKLHFWLISDVIFGGSWVVRSGVISPLVWVINIVTLLITSLILTHELPGILTRLQTLAGFVRV